MAAAVAAITHHTPATPEPSTEATQATKGILVAVMEALSSIGERVSPAPLKAPPRTRSQDWKIRLQEVSLK